MSESYLEIPGLDIILQPPGSLSLPKPASMDEIIIPSSGSLSLERASSNSNSIVPPCANNDHSSSSNSDDGLPRSVRNAPKELRLTIRRKQNKESARRGHERRYAQMELLLQKQDDDHERIRQLEIAMDELLSAVCMPQNGLNGEAMQDTGKHNMESSVPMFGNDVPWYGLL